MAYGGSIFLGIGEELKMKYLLILGLLLSCSFTQKGKSVNNLRTEFDQLWNYSDPVGTREKFRDHLRESDQKDRDYILQLKTQIARTHSLKAEFKDAHSLLDSVEKELNDQTQIAKVRYLLERGRTFNYANSNGDKKRAQKLFIKAYHMANTLKLDKYAVDSAHMAAIAAQSLDEKIKWTDLGIEQAAKSEDENVRSWVGVFLNNSGWDLFEEGRFKEALVRFQNCEEFHKEQGNKQAEDIAKWSVAKTYRYLGKTDKSLDIQLKLLEASDGNDPSGYIFEELGELYLVKKEEPKSKIYFSRAYEILSQDTWLQRNETERLKRLEKLSK